MVPTCSYKPDGFERGCHNTFHFVDVAIQRNSFDRALQGTNPHDLVAAISAAIAVLQDRPIPPPFPFSIRDKKEALLLLAHLIGDLHQPLHVGAVYLDPGGQPVDPDATHQVDPLTDTIGGNAIQDGVAVPFQTINLHREWDDIPTDLGHAVGVNVWFRFKREAWEDSDELLPPLGMAPPGNWTWWVYTMLKPAEGSPAFSGRQQSALRWAAAIWRRR